MKKVVMVLGALLMMVSGTAMVSAYEAHIVNVTAHVENAVELQGVGFGPHYGYDYGTVFPEEWMLKTFLVGVSDSFCQLSQQSRLNIDYELWVEEKDGYEWLGDALYFTVNWDFNVNPGGPKAADMLSVIDNGTPSGGNVADAPILVLSDSLNKNNNLQDGITMALDVPVFEGFYNQYTDVPIKQSGKSEPTVIINIGESRYPADMSLGVDLGVDVKIQVTRIY